MAKKWWAHKGSNLGPLPCEGNALPLSYAPGIFVQGSSARKVGQCTPSVSAIYEVRGIGVKLRVCAKKANLSKRPSRPTEVAHDRYGIGAETQANPVALAAFKSFEPRPCLCAFRPYRQFQSANPGRQFDRPDGEFCRTAEARTRRRFGTGANAEG